MKKFDNVNNFVQTSEKSAITFVQTSGQNAYALDSVKEVSGLKSSL